MTTTTKSMTSDAIATTTLEVIKNRGPRINLGPLPLTVR